jgi:hypothetical protein
MVGKLPSTTYSPHISERNTTFRSTVNMTGFTSLSIESGTYPTSCPTGLTGNFLAGKALKHENLYNRCDDSFRCLFRHIVFGRRYNARYFRVEVYTMEGPAVTASVFWCCGHQHFGWTLCLTFHDRSNENDCTNFIRSFVTLLGAYVLL